MFSCKSCGALSRYESKICKECKREIYFTENELLGYEMLLSEAVAKKDRASAAELHHILADAGRVRSMREFARALEEGKYEKRDLSLAKDYYLTAAMQNDPHSAYRYSRLIARTNDAAARFWLVYSAILGESRAYPDTAMLYSDFSQNEEANYFYTLSSRSGSVDSTVTLAERYALGIGCEKNEAYAKWYLDKLTIPPISAVKLAFSLRKVKGSEPPELSRELYVKILKELSKDAESYSFDTALLHLSKLLSSEGDCEAVAMLGILAVEGRGRLQNVGEGVGTLILAEDKGSVRAAAYLGELFSLGKTVKRDMNEAVRHFEKAGELSSHEAYERLGDLYMDGVLLNKNIAHAVDLYTLAAEKSESARAKMEKIKQERELLYADGLATFKNSQKDAFEYFVRAANMGHVSAIYHLGECYLHGFGVEKSRKIAFESYKRAAELGEPRALLPLGVCYRYGIGTRLSYPKASEAYVRAVRMGVPGAKEEHTSMLERKLIRTKDRLYSTAMQLLYMKKYKDAKNYLDIATELGHPKATYTVGCLYEFGIGVECNKNRAYELYEEAYSLKFRDPRARYKLIVLKMLRHGGDFIKDFSS